MLDFYFYFLLYGDNNKINTTGKENEEQ